MDLSIIIPNHNGRRTIEKCIKSIDAQRVKMKQLILVDDASTDNSARLVKERFPEIRIIEQNKNYGAAKARNDGIKNSRGDLLLFVDSDVYFSDSCLEEMLKYINKFDIIYPTVIFENGKVFSPATSNEKIYIRRSPVFLITRKALDRLDEFFDENYFIYYEDVDFFLRCYLAGLKCKYVERATAIHAVLPDGRNLERRFYLEAKNRIYCVIKFSKTFEKARKFIRIPTPRDVINTARTAFSNKNIYSNYPDHAGPDKICRSRLKLIHVLWRAILWNIFNLRTSLRKRRIIKDKYGKNKY